MSSAFMLIESAATSLLACRCLVVCKTLGVFATAHADGKLYLRLLPHLQVGEGSTVTVGEPVQTLTNDSSAVIQVWHCF